MLVAIFRRRLKEGATFEDFIKAWEADKGFGVPARVFNSVSLQDPREILSVGFVDIDAAKLTQMFSDVASQEAVRHKRITDVIESTELRTFYELCTEHDFSSDPRQIDLSSVKSLLASMHTA